MPLSEEEIKQIAIGAADEVIDRIYGTSTSHNPHNPHDPPMVTLYGVGPRPPGPAELAEREEEKIGRRRSGLRPGTHVSPPLEWEQIEKIQELKAEGLTFQQVADRLGLPRPTVWGAYHRGRPPLRRAITAERLREVVELRRQKVTAIEIARRIGSTREYVYYLLHRAGERIDPRDAAEGLQKRVETVTESLIALDNIPQLTKAADMLEEIADDAALLLEITRHIPLLPEYFPSHPIQIGLRASFAEEVLRSGAWCLEEKQKSRDIVDVLVAGRLKEFTVEHVPAQKELFKICGESAKEAAIGYLENKPGYETKAAEHMTIVEEMMGEVKR